MSAVPFKTKLHSPRCAYQSSVIWIFFRTKSAPFFGVSIATASMCNWGWHWSHWWIQRFGFTTVFHDLILCPYCLFFENSYFSLEWCSFLDQNSSVDIASCDSTGQCETIVSLVRVVRSKCSIVFLITTEDSDKTSPSPCVILLQLFFRLVMCQNLTETAVM